LEAIERNRPRVCKGLRGDAVAEGNIPSQATPGMLDALLRLPYECHFRELCVCDRQSHWRRVSLALRRQRAADDDSTSLAARVSVRPKMTSRPAIRPWVSTASACCVRETSLERLDSACIFAASTLADLGAVAVREDLALEPAFWGSFQ